MPHKESLNPVFVEANRKLSVVLYLKAWVLYCILVFFMRLLLGICINPLVSFLASSFSLTPALTVQATNSVTAFASFIVGFGIFTFVVRAIIDPISERSRIKVATENRRSFSFRRTLGSAFLLMGVLILIVGGIGVCFWPIIYESCASGKFRPPTSIHDRTKVNLVGITAPDVTQVLKSQIVLNDIVSNSVLRQRFADRLGVPVSDLAQCDLNRLIEKSINVDLHIDGTLRIEATANNPQTSALLANQVMASLVQFYSSTSCQNRVAFSSSSQALESNAQRSRVGLFTLMFGSCFLAVFCGATGILLIRGPKGVPVFRG